MNKQVYPINTAKGKASAPSHPLVVIQSICTTWTKASRGGSSAQVRNRTPEVLELPTLASPSYEYTFLLHEVIYTEHDCFQHPVEKFEQREQVNPCWYDCLKFEMHANTLDVMFEWERSEGTPRRSGFPRRTWSLQENQWGRAIYNLRIAGEDRWTYKKRVLAFGLFQTYSPRLFLETGPIHTMSDMAKLR